MAECLNDCAGDGDCLQACREVGSPDAVLAIDAIFACIAENACADADGAIDQDCLQTECPGELELCFGAPPEPSGDATCGELNECLTLCGDDDACEFACVEGASPEALELLQNAAACFQEADCEEGDGPCFQEACGDVIDACLEDEGPRPIADCPDLNECLRGCDGEACQDRCRALAPEGAVLDFDAILTCIEDNDCADEDGVDQACMQENCGVELEACFGPPPQPEGEGTCAELNECLTLCGGANDCNAACIEATSPEAFQTFDDAVSCIQASDCAPDDGACIQAACGDEIVACLGEPEPPRDPLTCPELNECLGACGDDEACIEQCREGSEADAVEAIDAALACVEENECRRDDGSVDQGCLDENCTDEVEACFGPPPEPQGDGTCGELNQCLSLCGGARDCQVACIEDSAQASFDLLVAASECVRDSGCEPDEAQCINEACGDEIRACVDDGGPQ